MLSLFWLERDIGRVEGLYYLRSENKGADQLRSYSSADLRLAKSRFSHVSAHIQCTSTQEGI